MKWNGNNKYIQFKAKWRDGFRWWPSCAFYWWPSSLMACPSKILPVQVNSRNHEINFHQRRSISSYLVSTKKPPPEMIENSGNTRYDFKSTCKSLWNDEMHYRRDDELEVFSSQGHWKISKSFTLNQSILLASTVQKIKILSQENIGESRKKWKKKNRRARTGYLRETSQVLETDLMSRRCSLVSFIFWTFSRFLRSCAKRMTEQLSYPWRTTRGRWPNRQHSCRNWTWFSTKMTTPRCSSRPRTYLKLRRWPMWTYWQ